MAVVSYKVEQPFLDYEAGEVVQLDQEQAQPFIDAGILAEATAEDVTGGEEEVTEEAPELVTNAAKDLETKFAKAVEETSKKIAEKQNKTKAYKAPTVPAQVKGDEEKTFGYKSLADYALTIARAEMGSLESRRRMEISSKHAKGLVTKAQMTTGGGPSVTATDGGNLIPPAYAATLFSKVQNVTSLKEFCQDEPFTGNTLEVPVDTTSSYGSGITVAWTSEASAITDSKPSLSMVEIKLNNLAALVNVTEYLLDDNSYGLDNYLQNQVPLKMIYELNRSILYGTGNGANVVSNAATVAATRTTAGTIKYADIVNMYSRMAQGNLPNAKWYISPSILPTLLTIGFADGTNQAAWMPVGPNGGYPSLTYQVAGYLLGHEVVLCTNMQALGNKGDIMFADLSAVSKIEKGLDAKATPYLYFDKAINTFRFIVRIGTGSRWTSPWTRPDSVTSSPYVVLTGNSVVP